MKPTDFDPAWLLLLSATPTSDDQFAAQLRTLDAIKGWVESIPEGDQDHDQDAA